jgi:predicted nucleic acid-binding protein
VTVVDASAAVELLHALERAEPLSARLLVDGESLIRRFQRRGELTAAPGAAAIEDLRDLPVHRHTHEPLLERNWALRASVTTYDAACLALAEALDAPLVTCDTALASVPGVRVAVEVF